MYIFPLDSQYNVIKRLLGGNMKIITAIASILIVLGALNWGLYGIAKTDLIEKFFGGLKNPIGKALYVLIGLAGLYSLFYIIFA